MKRGMPCPRCQHPESVVNDSRPNKDGSFIRRRRICVKCGLRWTTYERIVAVRQGQKLKNKIEFA